MTPLTSRALCVAASPPTGKHPRFRSPLMTCAHQEVVLAVRSRWTLGLAVVFGAMTTGVAFAGYIVSGGSGVQDFGRTAVSLVQLLQLVVSLNAVVMGVLALTQDRGQMELLYSQPVARTTVLAGKLLGLFAALVAAQAVGLGAAGLVIYSRAGSLGVGAFLALLAGMGALTAVFLSLAALVATCHVGRRARALAVALVVWIAATVFIDVVALAVASTLRSGAASRVLIVTVLANPVDAIRTGLLLLIEGSAAFGGASLAFYRFTGGTTGAALWLTASLAFWIATPLSLAAWRLRRADL